MINGRKVLMSAMLLFFALQLCAQQTTVKDMRRRVTQLQQQIKDKERILLTSEKDVASKLKNLNLLTARIGEHKALVALLVKEVATIDDEIKNLTAEVQREEQKVEKSKEEYAAALRRARRYGTLQDKLLFVVSADNFNSVLHRYRYTREYMSAHRKLAEKLKEQIAALEAKRAEVEKVRAGKVASLDEQRREQQTLKKLEGQQRTLVADLRRENDKVKKELARQRNELNKLNVAIDREIERELEARRKAETEAQAAKKKAQKDKVADATPKKPAGKSKKEVVKNEPQRKVDNREEPVVNPNSAGMKKLTGTFLENKGRLPVPITGSYIVVGSFGPQRAVAGKGNVQIDYGGITLQGVRGAKARSVFDGVVTSVVRAGDFAFVIVRHGKYLTVYCKLQNIRVAQGDKVKAGEIIADVAVDASGAPILLFQLRNEKVKLNPRHWLDL